MKPTLVTALAQERGTMRARATLQDPDVRVELDRDAPPHLAIDEGGVVLELAFPDLLSIHRFQERVANLRLPAADPGGRR